MQLLDLTCKKKRLHCEKSGKEECENKFNRCLKQNISKIEIQKNKCLQLVGDECYERVTKNHLSEIISEMWYQKKFFHITLTMMTISTP